MRVSQDGVRFRVEGFGFKEGCSCKVESFAFVRPTPPNGASCLGFRVQGWFRSLKPLPGPHGPQMSNRVLNCPRTQ